MSDQVIFLTHADVLLDPAVAVPDWGLNDAGRARHERFAQDKTLDGVTSVYASSERKAKDGAQPVAHRLGLDLHIRPDLGENDRSATGYLPEDAFWPVVHAFFAKPHVSTRGWETAQDAQTRILGAVRSATEEAPEGDVLIVSHGGVGTLLRCALLRKTITQDEGQPHPKGGCWFAFPRGTNDNPTDWSAI